MKWFRLTSVEFILCIIAACQILLVAHTYWGWR